MSVLGRLLAMVLCMLIYMGNGGAPVQTQPALPMAQSSANEIEVIDTMDAVTLTGEVSDAATGEYIDGAALVLERTSDGAVRTFVSADGGFFIFEALPADTYVLRAALEGYQDKEITRLRFAAGTSNDIVVALQKDMDPDEIIVRKVLDAIGADRIARLKAAGIDVSFSFDYGVKNGNADGGCLAIEIELRSDVGSTRWGNYQVDEALFRETQMAIIDSGAFDLSEADIAELKSHPYSEDNNYADVDLDCGVNMHINHTPNDEAIMFLRHTGGFPTGYSRLWYSSWKWDVMGYNNKE